MVDMDNKLKHLRKSMNQTVLKNHSLTTYDKEDLKRYVLSSKNKKERYYKYTMFSLTLTVTCVFLLVMSLYLNNKVHDLEEKVSDVVQAEQNKDEASKIDFTIKSGAGLYLPKMDVTNYVEGYLGVDHYKIYAGSRKNDPTTGLLYLVIKKGDGRTTSLYYSFAELKSPLEIKSIEGQELVLHSQGSKIYFNVVHRNIYYGFKPIEYTTD